MLPTTVQFARAAQTLAVAARAAGLVAPTFCSPPRRSGAVRTIRRRSDGHAVVAIRLRERDLAEVMLDMVDGVCAANALHGNARSRIRPVLIEALEPLGVTIPPGPPGTPEAAVESAVASPDTARMAERHTQAA